MLRLARGIELHVLAGCNHARIEHVDFELDCRCGQHLHAFRIQRNAGMLPFSGLGVVGMLFAGRKQSLAAKGRKLLFGAGTSVLLALSLFALGCGGGGNNSKQQNNNGSTVTMMVIGTSGAIVHQVPVTLTIH